MYFFSACLAFLVFGTIANVLCNFSDGLSEAKEDDPHFFWFVIAVASVVWVVVIPLSVVAVLLFLLKLLTDWISQYIIRLVQKRKEKKDECS